MKLRSAVLSLSAILLSACSGPPNFQLPDRPTSIEGVILSVQARDASTGIIEIGEPGASGTDDMLRQVDVTTETLILTSDSPYPATFENFHTGRFVRVWLDESTALVDTPAAEYIEIVATQSSNTPP